MPYSADRRDEARSCYSSSSSSSSSSRDRRRLRLLRLRWSQEQAQTGQQTHRGSELSFSAFQRRKRRQSLQSRMTKEEYLRLKHMVPAVATQPRVSKVQVIEEAIKYIDELHATLFQRLKAQHRGILAAAAAANNASGDPGENKEQPDDQLVKQWISRLILPVASSISNTDTTTTSPSPRERSKSWPSFLDRVDRMVRTKKQG